MEKSEAQALTLEDLHQKLGELTPEQRKHKAIWMGEERGGYIYSLHINPEDQVCPDNEGWEPRASFIKRMIDEDPDLKQEAEEEPIVAVKDQPYLLVD